ncbi:MAG: hypothetical protein GY847_01830 [Proteobacteria bacterium]|nr:hypothetical protein [Pseudomonadota bacterium]
MSNGELSAKPRPKIEVLSHKASALRTNLDATYRKLLELDAFDVKEFSKIKDAPPHLPGLLEIAKRHYFAAYRQQGRELRTVEKALKAETEKPKPGPRP